MDLGRYRGAVDEQFSARIHQQIIGPFVNLAHRRVIRHDRKDDISARRHVTESRTGRRS